MTTNDSKMNSLSDSLRKINEHRLKLIDILRPSDSDYGFGGSHRCWVMESAIMTADTYIHQTQEMSAKLGVSVGFPRHIAIPTPWEGERPAEIEATYGHPHSKFKDWRHFENTLRFRFADKGYICECIPTSDYKGLAFSARKMIDVAIFGTSPLKRENFTDNEFDDEATLPALPYDEWCANNDKMMEGTKIAEQKAIIDTYPPFMRPVIAMGMSA
jgi:hypothetical protein